MKFVKMFVLVAAVVAASLPGLSQACHHRCRHSCCESSCSSCGSSCSSGCAAAAAKHSEVVFDWDGIQADRTGGGRSFDRYMPRARQLRLVSAGQHFFWAMRIPAAFFRSAGENLAWIS